MTTVFKDTYILLSSESLHDWCSNNGVLPTNDRLFGKKLIRTNEPLGDMRLWSVSKPENTLGGEPFLLQTTVCFSRDRSRKEGKRKFRALTRDEALEKLCTKAGLEKVYEKDSAYAKAEPVLGLTIHGVEDKNVFHITGTFRVVNDSLFEKAYNEGVGRRKSYGCGLIVVL